MYEPLQRKGYDVTIAHPKKTKAIGKAKIKTDKIDSPTLAHLKRADLIAESYLALLETRELRELLREWAKVKSKIRTLVSKLNLISPKSNLLGKEAISWLKERGKKMPQVF